MARTSRLAIPFAIALVIAVAACGKSPAEPTSSPAPTFNPLDFSGVWRVESVIKGCYGDRHCVLSIGRPSNFTVRISQTRLQARAVVIMYSGNTPISDFDLEGTLPSDGKLVLTGNRPRVSPLASNLQARFEVQRDEKVGLSGILDYGSNDTPVNLGILGYRYILSVTRAERVSEDPQQYSYTGRWRGEHVVRRCVAVGWNQCYGEWEVRRLELILAETASNVEGTADVGGTGNPVPITGRTFGETLTLEGFRDVAPPPGFVRETARVTNWMTTRDDIGRLRGTFTFIFESERPGGAVWSFRYDSEIIHAVAIP